MKTMDVTAWFVYFQLQYSKKKTNTHHTDSKSCANFI